MIDCALLKNSSLIRIKVKGMGGNVRKVPVSKEAAEKLLGKQLDGLDTEEREKRIAIALIKLKASTTLIDCDELRAVTEYQSSFKKYIVDSFCNPSFIDEGWFTVTQTAVPALRKKFDIAQIELRALVEKFIAVYPVRKAAAEIVWGEKACSGLIGVDRMSRLLSQFVVDYRLTQLDVPEGLPPEIRAEEEAKLRKSFEDAQAAITGALWGQFKEFVDKIQERLTVTDDGKKKIFRDTLFEDLAAFVSAFVNKNAFNDVRLAALVQQANDLIARVGGNDNADKAQRMRDKEGLREQTAKAFADLATETEKAIAEKPERKFNFDE